MNKKNVEKQVSDNNLDTKKKETQFKKKRKLKEILLLE